MNDELRISLSNKENTSNKVTSISSSSTNTQYPSAKAVYDFKQSVEIQENDDLNDYTELGMYYSPTGTVSSTLSNCPVTNAFALFVEKGSSYENACTQTITTWNGSQIRKFIRYIQTYEGTFENSGWQLLYEDTGWKNLSFSSGYGNYDSSHPVRYRRIGKIVHIEGIFKNTNAIASGSSVQIGTITDTTCRPTDDQYSLQQGSSKNFFLLLIKSTGAVHLERYGTTANAQTTAGAWLHCNMTWFVD